MIANILLLALILSFGVNASKQNNQLRKLCDDEYESLAAKQKQIEVEHNITQQDIQSQFDQMSLQIQLYESKLNDTYKIQHQLNSQIQLLENAISEIDQLNKKCSNVHLNSDNLIQRCNHANSVLTIIDKNLQLLCINQGNRNHVTFETHLNDDHDRHDHMYKRAVCSNTRIRHMSDTFNRIVRILNESQPEETELSRKEQIQEGRINMEMKYIIKQKNDIVNETKMKVAVLEQEILSLKTNISQLTTQKQNLLIHWESMVDSNDFVTYRFSHDLLQTYYIIQFYIDTVLPLLIEQRVRWYASCYNKRAAKLYDPFVQLNFTWMKWELFSQRDSYLADKYNASIDLGLKTKDMNSRKLRAVYQERNEKLSQYMKQIESAQKHRKSLDYCVKTILQLIQEQLNITLGSLTLPTLENRHLMPIIHDDWKYTSLVGIGIDCCELNSYNAPAIVFKEYKLLRDILDTKRHIFSFIKKVYDIALYYQNKMNKLKKQEQQDLEMRMKINSLEWSILHNKAYILFLQINALGIDPTDDMMKSAFGLVTYRVEYLKETNIESIEFYEQIINKTYVNYWQKSRLAHKYQEFLDETLPFLATM